MNIWHRPEGMSEKDYINSMSKVAETLSMLLKTEGWKLYDQYMQQEERAILHAVKEAKSGDEALRASAALKVIQSVRGWPEEVVVQAARLLQSDAK